MLVGLGADVIKIEPPGGDPVRQVGPWYQDQISLETSLRWFALNIGKRSIVLDIDCHEGRNVLRRLISKADIVLESFAPGRLDELGLGYEELSALNERVVLTSISGYGQTGPFCDAPWSDLTILAMSGLLALGGDADRPPLRMSTSQSFFQASMQATIGTLLATYRSISMGRGQHVDVSVQEALTMALEGPGPVMNAWRMEGTIRGREGLYREPAPGFRFPVVLPCKDGHVAVATVLGQTLPAWLSALDEDGMAGDLVDERWKTASFVGTEQPGQWVPSPEEIDHVYEIVTAWTKTHTRAEIADLARRHHFLAGSQNTVLDILQNEQLQARGFFADVPHPELGVSITYPGAPFRMSRTPWTTGPRPPLLGEHTDEILLEIGVSADTVAGLSGRG
jgi:crotonobetainyl-CoA:carnitine CoA-transferase CaiB-like acyl-CoA transferase